MLFEELRIIHYLKVVSQPETSRVARTRSPHSSDDRGTSQRNVTEAHCNTTFLKVVRGSVTHTAALVTTPGSMLLRVIDTKVNTFDGAWRLLLSIFRTVSVLFPMAVLWEEGVQLGPSSW